MTPPSPRHLLATVDERLDPRHTAVLVIDMQNDYVSEGGAKHRRDGNVASAQAVISPLRSLLEAARRAGTLIIYVQMTLDYPGLRFSSDVEYLRRIRRYGEEPMVVKGTWGHEVPAEITPQPEDLRVEKQRSSAFVSTNLDLILRSNRIVSLILTGVVTHGCVFATGLSAMMADYYVTVAEDCVGTPRPDLGDAALRLLANYVQLDDAIVPSARIVEAWASQAGATAVATEAPAPAG